MAASHLAMGVGVLALLTLLVVLRIIREARERERTPGAPPAGAAPAVPTRTAAGYVAPEPLRDSAVQPAQPLHETTDEESDGTPPTSRRSRPSFEERLWTAVARIEGWVVPTPEQEALWAPRFAELRTVLGLREGDAHTEEHIASCVRWLWHASIDDREAPPDSSASDVDPTSAPQTAAVQAPRLLDAHSKVPVPRTKPPPPPRPPRAPTILGALPPGAPVPPPSVPHFAPLVRLPPGAPTAPKAAASFSPLPPPTPPPLRLSPSVDPARAPVQFGGALQEIGGIPAHRTAVDDSAAMRLAASASTVTGALPSAVPAPSVVLVASRLAAAGATDGMDYDGPTVRGAPGRWERDTVRTLVFAVIDRLFVVVYGTESPTDAEWTNYLGEIVRQGVDQTLYLIVTEGGAPKSAQRRELNDRLGDARLPVAVVSSSAWVRARVTVLSWCNRRTKAFRPAGLRDALVFLEIPATRHELITHELRKLWSQLHEPRNRKP